MALVFLSTVCGVYPVFLVLLCFSFLWGFLCLSVIYNEANITAAAAAAQSIPVTPVASVAFQIHCTLAWNGWLAHLEFFSIWGSCFIVSLLCVWAVGFLHLRLPITHCSVENAHFCEVCFYINKQRCKNKGMFKQHLAVKNPTGGQRDVCSIQSWSSNGHVYWAM